MDLFTKFYIRLSQIDIGTDELEIPTTTFAPDGDEQPIIQTILELAFGAIGAVAFLVIVIAGLQFILSRGNAEAAGKARNTIIYAAIGIVIAVLAFTIVRFVGRAVF